MSTDTSRAIALAAAKAIFADFDVEASTALVADDYIQHNPGMPTGAAPILGVIPALEEAGLKVTTHRVLAEDDLVVMHSTYENADMFGAPTLVAFDVFRIEDGKVAEHWDNLQVPGEPNPSGRTMVDGATEIIDLDRTAANKAVIEGFIPDVLMGGAPEKTTDYISTETYLQHNPGAGDGLEALGAAMAAMAEAGQQMIYERTPLIVAEGNFVFAASEGRMGDTPTAFFDLFRLDGGLIVEHWDVMADIPAADAWAHTNGKF